MPRIKEYVIDKKKGKKITILLKPSKNTATLASFVFYCKENPDQRFWQALRNWSGYGYIFASKKMSPDLLKHFEDTFYWEGRNA